MGRMGKRVAVVTVAAALLVTGMGIGTTFAQEEPSAVPTEVPQEVIDRLEERLASGEAGPLFGTVHAELTVTRFDGVTTNLLFDQGIIVERTEDTITIMRLDEERVTFAVDEETKVRDGLRPGSLDDLKVGDRAMFLSEELEDGTLHAVGIRCIERPHRFAGPPGSPGGTEAEAAAF